jgi:hypothetical protein
MSALKNHAFKFKVSHLVFSDGPAWTFFVVFTSPNLRRGIGMGLNCLPSGCHGFGSRPAVGEAGENTVGGEIVPIATAGLGVLGKFVVQGAGEMFGELTGQADDEFMAGEIKAERHAGGGIVFAIVGGGENIRR